jgi:hypothetical protein
MRPCEECNEMKMAAFWDIASCNLDEERRRFRGAATSTITMRAIDRMMDAVRTSETSVYPMSTTRRYVPESFNFHTQRHENLKLHLITAMDYTHTVGIHLGLL